MLKTISIMLTSTAIMLSTGAYAGGVSAEVRHYQHKDVHLSSGKTTDFVATNLKLSSQGVNIINFPAGINTIAEPPNQHLKERGLLQYIDQRSVMLSTGDYKHITLIVKLNNGHNPFILRFEVGNISSQSINVPTSIAGAKAQSAHTKAPKDANQYQRDIVDISKQVLSNDQNDIFVLHAGGDCELLAKTSMVPFQGLFKKLCGINKTAIKPDYIKLLSSDQFNILHARLCSQVFGMHVDPQDFVVGKNTVAITLTANKPKIGQCFDLVALSSKGAA